MRRALVALSASLSVVLMMGLLLSIPANAHTPLLSVEDNEDGTIYLEGGFSDGSTGAGVTVLVVKDEPYNGKEKKVLYNGKLVLAKGKLDEYAELTVVKPKVPYLIIFDAGPGHAVEKKGPAIAKDEEVRELESEEKKKVLMPDEKGIDIK